MGKKLTGLTWGLLIFSLITPALALNDSVGKAGIDARRLQQDPYNYSVARLVLVR